MICWARLKVSPYNVDLRGNKMQKNTQLNRRLFIGGQVALAASVGFGASAFALENQSSFGLEEQVSWRTGTADQFAKLINQQFTAVTPNGGLLQMKLVEAIPNSSGSARPKHLSRQEGVSLIFESDFAEDLAAKGHHITSVWNSVLGESKMFLGTIPRRSGGYEIEVILN